MRFVSAPRHQLLKAFTAHACFSAYPNSVQVVTPAGRGRQPEHRFIVCMAPMFNMNDTARLVEFLEMNRELGVTKFVFYIMNHSPNHPDVLQILDFYQQLGIVDLKNWNFHLGEVLSECFFILLFIQSTNTKQ